MSQLRRRLGNVKVPFSSRRSAARLISVPMFQILPPLWKRQAHVVLVGAGVHERDAEHLHRKGVARPHCKRPVVLLYRLHHPALE